MMPAAERGTTLARVRLRGGGSDPLAAEMCARQVLGLAMDVADAVPAEAILCVRRLSDPRPGQVVLASRTAPDAWTHAVRARVQDLARRASHPARDPAPETAEAVIFADRAELLACLARDWCRGALGRWWWRPLLRAGEGPEAIVTTWLVAPIHVPAALARAVSMGAAHDFVRRLPRATIAAFVESIVTTHGLAWRERVAQDSSGAAGDGPVLPAVPRPASLTASVPTPDGHRAPWRAWAPEANDTTLRRDQQFLLGVALTVIRTPALARSAAFAADAVRWWRADPVANAEAVGERETKGDQPGDTCATTAPGAGFVASRRVSDADDPTAEAFHTRVVNDGPPASDTLPVTPVLAARDDDAATLPAAASLLPATDADVVETSCAGVFYLLNVALALELYGDFTQPMRRGLELAIWDFVALFGRRLLARHDVGRDPVWPLLGRLAGRAAGEPAGVGFDPPDRWRLPAAWLDAFPEREGWRSFAAGDRLRVRHPAGFLVIDIPRTSAPAPAQAIEELTQYRAGSHPIVPARTRPFLTAPGTAPDDPLACWLAWLVPYVRARLARALGVRNRAAGPLVCRAPGRIRASATRLEVQLTLADLPVEVRVAGLDRDPGWIPAAGRVVSFRFE